MSDKRRYFLADGSPGGPWGPFETEEERDRQAEILREVAEANRHAEQILRERHPELFVDTHPQQPAS
jgi:hypothetical protein